MSNDTHVREFLERMANEIYVPPLDWRSPVKRARRHRSITMAVVVVIVTAIVAAGSVGLRSITDTRPRPANESTPPLMPLMRNGPIDVFGYMNAVRTLTPDGLGTSIFDCQGSCPEVGGADWSPDGTRLAFTALHPRGSQYDGLHVVDPARGTDRLVVHGQEIGYPAWSPDGTRIAYVQLQQIFVVNEDGSGQTPVVTFNDENTFPSHPSWSPDGSRIVYSAGGQLFVVGLDGSAPSPLVQGYYPTWSPDGSTIAYVGGGGFQGPPGGCDVRETTPAGGYDSSLIDLATVGPDPKRCELTVDLEWSPDGAKLAAVVERYHTTRVAVVVMKADGSSARMFSGWGAQHSYFGLTWRPVQATAG